MNHLATDLSKALATAVVTAAALAGCAGAGGCHARGTAGAAPCSFAVPTCGAKKCGACAPKKK
jgi:hypothetical protein